MVSTLELQLRPEAQKRKMNGCRASSQLLPDEEGGIVLSFVHAVREVLIHPAHIVVVVAILHIAHTLRHHSASTVHMKMRTEM